MKVRALIVLALSLVTSIPLIAQTCSPTSYTNTLICTVPQLFGPQGLTLPNPNHNAHFADVSEAQFRPLNQAIGQELSILPLGSSGSGTTFTLDSQGHAVPTEDSLGPILTERANVIGRKAIDVGIAYQYFSFSRIDGIDLHSFPAVLIHTGSQDLDDLFAAFQNDYIKTSNEVHLALNQTVVYAVVGVTKRMDASVELPIQSVHFRVASSAHIVRTLPCEATQNMDPTSKYYKGGDCIGSLDPPFRPGGSGSGVCGEFHYFQGTTDYTPDNCETIFTSVDAAFPYPGAAGLITNSDGTKTPQPARTAAPTTNATGIGDIIVRGKYEVIRGEKFTGSIGMGVRFPSGDAKNFLGTGAYGVIPFGVLSYRGRVSPHVRLGYQWNSHSVLAGDPTGLSGATSASLAPAWLYSAGADYRATKRLTIVGDLIGQSVLSASRLILSSYSRLPETDGTTNPSTETTISVPSIKPQTASYSSIAIAAGAKVRLMRQLILMGNATMRVNDGGLKASVVPLVGLSYAF